MPHSPGTDTTGFLLRVPLVFFAQPDKPERAITADPDAWYDGARPHSMDLERLELRSSSSVLTDGAKPSWSRASRSGRSGRTMKENTQNIRQDLCRRGRPGSHGPRS